MSNLGIYIPSLGRSNMVHKGPLTQVPEELLEEVNFVVSHEECEEYKTTLPDGCQVHAIDMSSGIGAVRQWIIENAVHPYVLFIDDDTNISYREEETGKLKKCGKEQFKDMFNFVQEFFESGYAHVGLSERATNYTVTGQYAEIGKMYNTCVYNRSVLLEQEVRFDTLSLMEDYDVTLSLLEKGFPNAIIYKYAFEQRKSGEVGGCSTYRTWEMQRKAAFKLAERHPGCVKVITKNMKEAWENVGAHRVDVNINWKKAYRPKRRTEKSGVAEFFK